MANFIWDQDRPNRTGIEEAVFCQGKSREDLESIVAFHFDAASRVLLTRLSMEQWEALPNKYRESMRYNPRSRVGFMLGSAHAQRRSDVGIVCAGTSDLAVAEEARDTLAYYGYEAPVYSDVGVAGLWRLMERLEDIRLHRIVIAVAGMEGALFSVLGGLVKAPIIAVPSSVGYGVTEGGRAALHSALGSCASGLLTVNIDNGYGAAVSSVKILSAL